MSLQLTPIRAGATAVLLAAALTLTGCDTRSATTTVGPTPARCGVSASPDPSSFPPDGGSGTLRVSSARECAWSAASQAAWITLASPTDGQGDGTVRYTVASNPVPNARDGTLVVGGASVRITQQAARCGFELSRRTFELGPDSGGGDIDVRARDGCPWSARSGAPWISILDGGEGTGPGRVRFRVAANAAREPRSGSLEVAGQQVDVRQSGAQCRYAVTPRTVAGGPGPVEGSLSVETDAGCAWTATSDQPWITFVGAGGGSGRGTVQFRLAANPSVEPRSAAIDIGGVRVDVQQQGRPCEYALSPSDLERGPGEVDGSVAVETSAGCDWSARSDQPWLTISGGASGSGPGTVRFRAPMNEGAATRTGRITVNDRVFTLRQAACTYAVDPASASFRAIGGTGRIDVRSPSPCPWTAEAGATWITIVSGRTGTGDGRVTYSVLPNVAGSGRSATIAVAGRTFTVTQEGPGLSGAIRNLAGSCPTREFAIRDQPVRTNGSTRYDGGSCRDLRNGVVVRVKGDISGNGVLTAREVDF